MTPPTELILHVNGGEHRVAVDPETPLLTVLRQDLGLTGPKYGCGSEQCGACKVLVDGVAVPSCQLPVGQVGGLPVVTVEGLGTADAMHPLQEAFAEEQAIQCGYCAAGMIIAAQGLLNRVRYPTDDQIREALADNLCRCGIYDRVRRAIKLRVGRPEPARLTVRHPAPVGPPSEAALPPALLATPELDRWLRVDEADTVTAFSGKVELGQGLRTALAQIVAEELDLALERVRVVMADTALTPDEGNTVSSMSLETSGAALRWAAAEARRRLLAIAYEELEAPPERLVVDDGVIRDPVSGRETTYWAVAGGRPLGGEVTGVARPKAPAAHRLVGTSAPRLDLPAKVTGAPAFIQDLTLPGMAHARVVRPPHPGARLAAVDAAAVERLPGVLAVVRDGSFLAVVAEREEQAARAAEALRERAAWEGAFSLADEDSVYAKLFDGPAESNLVVDGATVDGPIPPWAPPAATVRTRSASYHRPYQMHGALGPATAVAHLEDGRLTLWVQTQGVFPQREAIAAALGLPAAAIRVIQRDGPGVYGHSGADDAALDVALVARNLPGRPIRLAWTRADEHRWEPYAPAMRIDLAAALDAAGNVLAWSHDVWSLPHFGRARGGPESTLIAAGHLATPLPQPPARAPRGPHSAGYRNADPLYAFPARRIVHHHLPESPLRTSSLRGLGAFANVFAIESFMDELADAAGADPLAFRLRHLADERARAVLLAAAERAGWQPGGQQPGPGRGRGLALARYKNRQAYAAVVVDLAVAPGDRRIRLERAVIAADAGQIVSPDGLANQLEGGFVQAASQALFERVTWDAGGLTSVDWDSYPILRFPDAPVVEVVLLNRPDAPTVGAGEAATGPTPAAIANAVFATTGRRLRAVPFMDERTSTPNHPTT